MPPRRPAPGRGRANRRTSAGDQSPDRDMLLTPVCSLCSHHGFEFWINLKPAQLRIFFIKDPASGRLYGARSLFFQYDIIFYRWCLTIYKTCWITWGLAHENKHAERNPLDGRWSRWTWIQNDVNRSKLPCFQKDQYFNFQKSFQLFQIDYVFQLNKPVESASCILEVTWRSPLVERRLYQRGSRPQQ